MITLANKGDALSNLGQYDEAVKLYDRALAINPNETGFLNNKGIVLSNPALNMLFASTYYNKGIVLSEYLPDSE